LEAVKKALDKNGIEMPIPKQENYRGENKSNQTELRD
jgi:small-conductance mechanosensitive channel